MNIADATARAWRAVRPEQARHLTDARLQLHHAAQLPVAFAISYLEPQPDDSHTNLEWLPELGVLASNSFTDASAALRLAIRIEDLTLLFMRGASVVAELPLAGRTIAGAAEWITARLHDAGLPADRFTLKKHYEIPAHAVAAGAAFDAAPGDLRQLAAWYEDGAVLLEALRSSSGDASPVRCWPHHFDIATLITPGAGSSVGVGLEPGDAYYDEPYFYVNAQPQPAVEALPLALGGGGNWHTSEWIGAVLPASRLAGDAPAQARQAAAFVESAVAACRMLVARR
jgi:hypothetical protein